MDSNKETEAHHVNGDIGKKDALESLLDELLERYLQLLDQYQACQKQMGSSLSAVICMVFVFHLPVLTLG